MNAFHLCLARWWAVCACVLLTAMSASSSEVDDGEADAARIELRECLAIGQSRRAGRTAIRIDPIELALLTGRFTTPEEGDEVKNPEDETKTWQRFEAGDAGDFRDEELASGYAYFEHDADEAGVAILEAAGHSMVYVNGVPRTGDTYSYGMTKLPIKLTRGRNELLFATARGNLRVALAPPAKPAFLDTGDNTLPDLIIGEDDAKWGAMIVVNATEASRGDLFLASEGPDGKSHRVSVGGIVPLATRKAAFQISGAPVSVSNDAKFKVRLESGDEADAKVLDEVELSLRVVAADDVHRRTFVSEIDGSVQYYAVRPARPVHDDGTRPALFLSLHGASVQALGQAEAYSSKTWGHIVAPTNRRPYGFDWEDWGQRDTMEVLELAQQRYNTDPQRTYLTGHSMGGHGTWIVGATYPSRFAAIGPSAGWISFWTYVSRSAPPEDTSPAAEMLRRASAMSRPRLMSRNYLQQGIYVLHGDADDNVPVEQARMMRDHLATFHNNVLHHEQPGAGHWWNSSDEPGASCVDWAEMFDMFARRRIPRSEEVRDVEFFTANPGVSASCHWATIYAQQHHLRPSSIDIRFDPGQRRFRGTTDNVARLVFDVRHVRPDGPLTFDIDGQSIEVADWMGNDQYYLDRHDDSWSVATSAPDRSEKGPHRYGPFKDAFAHRMMFVFGTAGTPEENAWSLARARFDAEAFWYRGNGSIDVVADADFDATAEPDRGVILYGNADTNSAWGDLLAGSPVQVDRRGVTVDERRIDGEDLACLFLQPRPGSDTACVGVVAGTGLTGSRLTERCNYFLAGAAYPDLTVFGTDFLETGAAGNRVTGFFGLDWSVVNGQFAWNDDETNSVDAGE